ncbi:MAG: nitrate reductase molybdenum cofactor assembly chaperone [Caulobacteraceae bacterium]
MSATYQALALLLRYPSAEVQALAAEAGRIIATNAEIPSSVRRGLRSLAAGLSETDLYDLQERYVGLFDRTRSLSLNLYEHVHGESRDRGEAMVGLLELYRRHGLELSGCELPDHLPVFLEFLSTLPEAEAASLLGEAAHVLSALGERLYKRQSPYRAVFAALAALADQAVDGEALAALLSEPEDDPDDLEAMDRMWAEAAVTFGPGDAGCPKAEALVAAMNTPPAPRRPLVVERRA